MVSAVSAAARTACCVVLVAVSSVLPYLNTLDTGFAVADYGLVVLNPQLPPFAPLTAAFTGPSTAPPLYRPLTIATYLVNHRAGGGAFGFHLGNVLLFACTTAVAFVLARRLSGSLPVALAAALVWAVHPVHADSVASITGRAEILGALFVFGSLLALAEGLAAAGAARRWWLGGSGLAFAAALCSTEGAAAAVLLVPLVAWRHAPARRPALLMVASGTYVGLALAFVAVRAAVVGAPVMDESTVVEPLAFAGPWVRAATAAVVSWQYVGLLTVPFGPLPGASERVPAVVAASDPRLVIALLGLAGVVFLAAVCRRYAPLVTFGIVFTATVLAGAVALKSPAGAMAPARLLFLPSFGWCLAAGAALATWIGRPADRRRVAAAGVLLGLLALGTWTRNVDWRDDEALLTVTAQAPSAACLSASPPSPAGGRTTSCR